MEQETHEQHIYCPINAVLNLLSERWTLHIVRALLSGKKRFNEVARELGINPSTLRERLRALEDEGVITRTVVCAMPPKVEYALTEKGLALNGVLEGMADWGRIWMNPPQIVPSESEETSKKEAKKEVQMHR